MIWRCFLPYFNGLFPIHVNEIASTVDVQNRFLFKQTKGTCIKGKNDLKILARVQGCIYSWSICIC